MTLSSFTHAFRYLGSKGGASFKRHSGFVLFALCALVLGLWGWIFWSYVYVAADAQPQVTVQPVNVKSADLDTFLSDIKDRSAASDATMSKSFPDPFLKPPDAQP